MSDRSERKQDWLGNEYEQHYDKDGRHTGWSERKTDWLGDEYTQYHSQDGAETGWSEERKDWLGNDYVQHRTQDGTEAGWSERKTDWLGDEYTQHHSQDGAETGWSEERKDWLGNDYVQHHRAVSATGAAVQLQRDSSIDRTTGYSDSDTDASGGISSLLVLALLVIGVIAFVMALVTAFVWVGATAIAIAIAGGRRLPVGTGLTGSLSRAVQEIETRSTFLPKVLRPFGRWVGAEDPRVLPSFWGIAYAFALSWYWWLSSRDSMYSLLLQSEWALFCR